MPLINCKKCGRMFNHGFGPEICDSCKKQLEDDFQRTKEFLRGNPAASIKQIAEGARVTTGQIQKWVNEERLIFTEESPVKITCDNCGARIFSGQYCEKCKNEIKSGLRNMDNAHKAKIKAEAEARALALEEARRGKMNFAGKKKS